MMNKWENVDVSLSIGIDIDDNQDIGLESQINMIRYGILSEDVMLWNNGLYSVMASSQAGSIGGTTRQEVEAG